MPNWWDEDVVSNKPSTSSSVGKTKEKNWWEDDIVGPNYTKATKKGEPLEEAGKGFWDSDLVKGLTFRGDKESLMRQGSGFGQSAVKGIPVLGKLAPENKYQDKYEEENPMMSALGNVVGGVGSTIPLAGGVAARSGAGLLSQMGNQGMLGTTLAGADKLAEKGNSVQDDEMLKALGLGAASGMAGPVVARGLSPKSYVKPTVQPPKGPDPSLSTYDKLVLKTRPNAREIIPPKNPELERIQRNSSLKAKAKLDPPAQKPNSLPPWLDKALDHGIKSVGPGLLGGVLGSSGGWPGMVVGGAMGAAAPHIKEIINKGLIPLAHNSVMQQPAQMAILNALMMTGADQYLDQ